jgi:hypothetical protein
VRPNPIRPKAFSVPAVRWSDFNDLGAWKTALAIRVKTSNRPQQKVNTIKRHVFSPGEEAPRMPTDYIDPRDVLVTGLLGKDANRAEADRMATAAGRRPVFDPDIGWILVPPSVVK